jgi:uncharacterized protein (TIGR02145 family)
VYRYIRQAKSEDCTEWQSSNEFTVSVVGPAATATPAPYIDPRDGKMYQTVKMPDNKIWFAQDLNYTKDLYYNTVATAANGAPFTGHGNGVPAIGSYWCPAKHESVASGGEAACNLYGALYTWETVMMVDGKYADDARTSTTWDESWVSGNYFNTGAPGTTAQANINNARGGHGICPPGWHVPTDYEWANLLDKVDGNGTGTTYTNSQTNADWWGTDAGQKLKSADIYTGTDPGDGSWLDDANRGTNTTGFSAVPTGSRSSAVMLLANRGIRLRYWSSSVDAGDLAWHRSLDYNSTQVQRFLSYRSNGFSVRCVRE